MLRHTRFLFDLDGVILDTKEIQVESTVQAIFDIEGEKSLDMSLIESTVTTKDKLRLMAQKGVINQSNIESIYQRKKQLAESLMLCLDRSSCDDKKKIFDYISSQSCKFAIVTNANRETTELVLGHFGISGFEFLITNDEVKNPKPHSEPYILAMLQLGGSISDYLIFEDSEVGITSARGTGADVFVVANSKLLDLNQFLIADSL